MNKQRNRMPLLTDRLFLSDGGLDTTLIIHEKLGLPMMAAFPLARAD